MRKARVEVQRRHHHVDAIAQRFDHVIGAAAGVVIGGQIPGGLGTLQHLIEHLGVVVAHQRQQCRLGASGNPVVLVDNSDAHLQPSPPGDPYVLRAGGFDQVGGQRAAQQVCHRHLRMTMLHPAADFGNRVAGQDAHQYRTGRLAPARSADEQAPSPDREVEQGDQDEAAVGLAAGKIDLGLGVAESETLVSAVEVVDVVMRADDRLVDDPEVGLTQLFIERDLAGMLLTRTDGTPVEVGDIEDGSTAMVGRGVGGCLGYMAKLSPIDQGHVGCLLVLLTART